MSPAAVNNYLDTLMAHAASQAAYGLLKVHAPRSSLLLLSPCCDSLLLIRRASPGPRLQMSTMHSSTP